MLVNGLSKTVIRESEVGVLRYLILVAICSIGCSPADTTSIGPSPTKSQLDQLVKSGKAFSVNLKTGEVEGNPPSGVVPEPPPPLPK